MSINQMMRVNLKRLHTVSFQLLDILERVKPCKRLLVYLDLPFNVAMNIELL